MMLLPPPRPHVHPHSKISDQIPSQFTKPGSIGYSPSPAPSTSPSRGPPDESPGIRRPTPQAHLHSAFRPKSLPYHQSGPHLIFSNQHAFHIPKPGADWIPPKETSFSRPKLPSVYTFWPQPGPIRQSLTKNPFTSLSRGPFGIFPRKTPSATPRSLPIIFFKQKSFQFTKLGSIQFFSVQNTVPLAKSGSICKISRKHSIWRPKLTPVHTFPPSHCPAHPDGSNLTSPTWPVPWVLFFLSLSLLGTCSFLAWSHSLRATGSKSHLSPISP